MCKRNRLLISLFILFSVIPTIVFGDNSTSVTDIKLLNDGTTLVSLKIPSKGFKQFYVPSSTGQRNSIAGNRRIVRITNDKGEDLSYKDIPDDTALVDIKDGDSDLNITYTTPYLLKNSPFKLVRFPNFYNDGYPSKNTTIFSYPAGYKVLSLGSNSKRAESLSSNPIILNDESSIKKYPDMKMLSVFVVLDPLINGYVLERVGNISVVGNSTFVKRVVKDIKEIQNIRDIFMDSTGLKLPDDILIAITDTNDGGLLYDNSALMIQPNIILIDYSILSYDDSDIKKVIVHELAHIAMSESRIFSDSDYNAQWFKEGLAVFSEQYFTDNYLNKTGLEMDIDIARSGYGKFTLDDLKLQNTKPFDYDFNGIQQPVSDSYSHAGAVMYALFLKDNSIFPKLFSSLINTTPDTSCDVCDTDKILNIIKKITRMNEEDILFPGKSDSYSDTKIIDKITRKKLSEEREKEIRSKITKTISKHNIVDLTNTESMQIKKQIRVTDQEVISTDQKNVSTSTISQKKDIKYIKNRFIKNLQRIWSVLMNHF